MFLPIRVKQGKPDYEMLTDYLSKKKDGIFYVKVELPRNPRSLNQNSLLWMWYGIIADATGHSPEQLHRIFKRMFLEPKFEVYRGKEIKLPGSTTTLSTSEFANYLDNINSEASDLGIILPQPNDRM